MLRNSLAATCDQRIDEHSSEDGISLLLRAYRHASDAKGDPWQFAIRVSELKSKGLHDIDLSWLLNKGFAEHAVEITIPGDLKRCFRTIETRIVQVRTFYTLTKNGYVSLSATRSQHGPEEDADAASPSAHVDSESPSELEAAESPGWNASQREL